MSAVLHIVLVASAVLFLLVVLRLVSQGKLLLKYSLLWLVLGVVALIIALFPSVAGSLSHTLGFGLTSNFVFFVVLALLGVICMALTVIVSWQARDIRSLVQQMALLKKELQEERHNGQRPDGRESTEDTE